jgi:DNA polymerase
MTFDHTQHALAGLLEWYQEMGVDLALEDAAIDRFAPSAATAPTLTVRQNATATPNAAGAIASPDQAAQSARELAASARTLDDLRAAMEGFDGCALKKSATRLAFADGTPGARVMLIGEAPGREEDEQGKPFVGRAGQLLDRMLAAIGLDRGQVYIANVVPWRPPGNRTPTPQEIAICLPFITRQIELCAPDVLVCIGAPSSQTILGQRDGILRLRGRWFDYDCAGRTVPALATLHPAYLLRVPAQKKLAWQDLRSLSEKLRLLPPKPAV